MIDNESSMRPLLYISKLCIYSLTAKIVYFWLDEKPHYFSPTTKWARCPCYDKPKPHV